MYKQSFVIIFVLFSTGLLAQDYVELSKKLAALRTDVEQLNQDVQEERSKYTSELRSYSMQNAELEATVRKEEIKKKQFEEKMKQVKEQLSSNEKGSDELKPLVVRNIDKLRTHIASSMPYKKEQRLSNLDALKQELVKGEISSYQALSRLWGAFEDEDRLSRENQIAKEQVDFNGQTYLAEVLKLGNVALYFRLESGVYGKAVKKDSDWSFKAFDNNEQVVAAKNLFEGVKRQIKTAQYEIPNGFSL